MMIKKAIANKMGKMTIRTKMVQIAQRRPLSQEEIAGWRE
jgi:hypothetical protein